MDHNPLKRWNEEQLALFQRYQRDFMELYAALQEAKGYMEEPSDQDLVDQDLHEAQQSPLFKQDEDNA